MGLHDLAVRMDGAADALADASAAFLGVDPGARAFGGDAPGRLGDLGRTLHTGLSAGLAARGREAAAHGARLADTARALRQAAGGYDDTDRSASDRHSGGEQP